MLVSRSPKSLLASVQEAFKGFPYFDSKHVRRGIGGQCPGQSSAVHVKHRDFPLDAAHHGSSAVLGQANALHVALVSSECVDLRASCEGSQVQLLVLAGDQQEQRVGRHIEHRHRGGQRYALQQRKLLQTPDAHGAIGRAGNKDLTGGVHANRVHRASMMVDFAQDVAGQETSDDDPRVLAAAEKRNLS